jgi:hypothetical protein
LGVRSFSDRRRTSEQQALIFICGPELAASAFTTRTQHALFDDVHGRIVWIHLRALPTVKEKAIGFVHLQSRSHLHK